MKNKKSSVDIFNPPTATLANTAVVQYQVAHHQQPLRITSSSNHTGNPTMVKMVRGQQQQQPNKKTTHHQRISLISDDSRKIPVDCVDNKKRRCSTSTMAKSSQQNHHHHYHRYRDRKLCNNNIQNTGVQHRGQNLWRMFQKYRSEIEELRQYFNAKWTKIKMLEEKINDLILVDDELDELFDQQAPNFNGNGAGGSGDFHDDDYEEEGEELDDDGLAECNIVQDDQVTFRVQNHSDHVNNHYAHRSNTKYNLMMFEPIIDIQIKDDNDSNESHNNSDHQPDQNLAIIQSEMIPDHENHDQDGDDDVTMLETEEEELSLQSSSTGNPKTTKKQRNLKISATQPAGLMILCPPPPPPPPPPPSSSFSSSIKKGVHNNIHSKNEFLQMVEKHKQDDTLFKEKLSANVLMLRGGPDKTIIGYQCSIDDCAYMHFLRAQVNRHFKNFHSKTCSHCNVRFKRPYELSLHLKELKLKKEQSQFIGDDDDDNNNSNNEVKS